VTLHPSTSGFDRAADVYDRARPGYPDALVDRLLVASGTGPGATVADVAAGTGKLTRRLAARGLRVIAVEPVAGMRAVLAATTPGVEVLDGVAEALPLGDASVDGVTVAQGFHWFANDDALAELRRVLRPGGRLALVWNTRDLDEPLQAALHGVLSPYRRDEPRHGSGSWEAAFRADGPFVLREHSEQRWVQEVSRELLVERALSTSFIAALPPAERDRVAARVRGLAPAEPVGLAYTGELFVYDAR
jgi:ubiquinone/menaquinone biosynthesis C-methylase UbiE